MPIIIPDNLPARWMLESEGIFVIGRGSAQRQDLRPLRIALVLPDQERSRGRGLARLLAQSPLQIQLVIAAFGSAALLQASGPADDTLGVITPVQALEGQVFDGMVVAHAPYDARDWHQTPNWDEFRDLLDWSDGRVRARMFVGWSAQAALQHVYGLASQPLNHPRSGIFTGRAVRRQSFLLRGFDEQFGVPVSTASQIDADDLQGMPGLQVLADTLEVGPYLVRNANRRDVFVLGHPEFDEPLAMDAVRAPGQVVQQWRSHASLLLLNWLNYYVYQPISQQVDPVLAAPPLKHS